MSKLEGASPSYKSHRGMDCYMLDDDDPGDPCWGPVEITDEVCAEDFSDCWWTYACRGHAWAYAGGDYVPEPPREQPNQP